MKKVGGDLKISKLTNEKYLNLFCVEYKKKGIKWLLASRRDADKLEILNKSKNADAVNILPYSVDKNGEIEVYLIREFRHAIGDYIYSVPAGLVENNKTEEQSVKAEIYEEIGGEVVSCKCVDKNVYTTVGLTDEKISFFEAEVKIVGKQHLEKTEEIELVSVPLKKVEKMLDDKKIAIDLKGRYSLRHFVENQKIAKLEKQNAELIAKLKQKPKV